MDENNAAFAYGDLDFVQCDTVQNWDPVNKQCCHSSCTAGCTGPLVWQCNIVMEDNCNSGSSSGELESFATLKICQDGSKSRSFYGGEGQCSKGTNFQHTFLVDNWHEKVTEATITGKIWVFD